MTEKGLTVKLHGLAAIISQTASRVVLDREMDLLESRAEAKAQDNRESESERESDCRCADTDAWICLKWIK